jgi:IS30 family transposase
LLRRCRSAVGSLAPFSQADLDDVADELNGRPRQTLNWLTPSEAFDDALR